MPFGQRFDRREAFCRRSRSLSSSPAPQKKEQGSGSREKKSEDRSDPDEDHRDMESAAPLFEHVDPRLGSSPLLQMDYRRTQAYDFYHKRSTRLELKRFQREFDCRGRIVNFSCRGFQLSAPQLQLRVVRRCQSVSLGKRENKHCRGC